MKKGSHVKPESLAKMRESKLGEKNPFFGKTHSAEARAKFSAVHKGKKLSEETKLKISKSHTVEKIKCHCKFCGKEFFTLPCYIRKGGGKFCNKQCESKYRKGKQIPKEVSDKISLALKGRALTPEWKVKISKARMGKYTGIQNPRFGKQLSEETKAKLRAKRIGKPLSEEHKVKIRDHTPRGADSPHWRGGKSFEPYCLKFNPPLRNNVREFFGNHCINCGKSADENFTKSGKCELLSVHHVFTEKMACCESKIEEMEILRNRLPPSVARHGQPEFSEYEIMYIRMMVPLCRHCHSILRGEPDDITYEQSKYRKKFTEIIIENYNGKCYD
jgi:hypothetical protein